MTHYPIKHYSKEDDQYLITNFASGDIIEISNLLNRSPSSVYNRAKTLGLALGNNTGGLWKRWTKDDIAYLRENYDKKPIEEIVEYLGREKRTIRVKASNLGLTPYSKRYTPWSDDEVAFLRENYGKIPNKELSEKMGRTSDTINTTANNLGLARKEHRKRWTDEESQILRDNCEKTLNELCDLIPSRSRDQIKIKRTHVRFPSERAHRNLLKRAIGRDLEPHEHIHHINFDHFDNRIENLDIVTRYEHGDLHKQIFAFVKDLMDKGILVYDRTDKRYFINI